MSTKLISRRLILQASMAAATGQTLPSWGQAAPTKIVFGYTTTTDYAGVYIASEEGFFKKRNLDVELKLIAINSTIPAAIEAGSLQLGGPTPSVYLQSVAGGLDHVVVAGGGLTSKTNTSIGLVAKAGSGIRTAQDCVGRKVGVPALGAYLHVILRAWMKQSGVDYKKVTFVESSFQQHADLLRGGSVDAVATADPILSRITDAGIGYVVSYYPTFLPEGQPTLTFVGTREWVQKNLVATKAFRDGVVEGVQFAKNPANNETVRRHIGKYIKLPPEVLAKMQMAPLGATVNEKQLAFWIGLMREQEMLKTEPAVSSLIAKL